MDIQYLLFLQKVREASGGILDSFMLRASELGEGLFTYLLLALVYWCMDKRSGQLMALNVSIACTWNQFIKRICKIERPWVRDERIVPVQEALANAGGYSFPSGHTTRGTAVWGALGLSLWKRKEHAVSVICWAVVAAIAFSRNYLGVHTLTDVVAALAAGILLALIWEKILTWADGENNRDIIIALVGGLLCFLPMLKVGCLSNAGAGMGFLSGWVLERHFVKFEPDGSWREKCVRFAIGGAGIAFIISVVQSLLNRMMEAKYAGFFTMFALGIFVMAAYPFFYSRAARYKAGVIILAALLAGIFGLGILDNMVQNEKASVDVEITENGIESGGEVGTQGATESLEEAGETGEAGSLQESENLGEAGNPGQAEMGEENDTLAGSEEGQEGKLPQIIAHRGYSAVFPENTLSSFAGAIDIGVDYIELDVQLTKDGQVVVFHDDTLERITGMEGRVADYSYEEILQMDAGNWFNVSYAGEKIPTLQEALMLIKDSECSVYLELKDIGEREGFVENVYSVVQQCGMADRCIYASFLYRYLTQLKEMDPQVKILYNTTSGKISLLDEFPADYYGLYVETITSETVNAIHSAGKQAFVWTISTPWQLQNVKAMGVDGVVTNYPGRMKVLGHSEYEYLVNNYEDSVTMPGLYGKDFPEECEDMVVQGFTRAGGRLVVSAYSRSGEHNSILYIMDAGGKLQKVTDLGFKAHTGGIAYDELHDLLWVTGPEGQVYALSWPDILRGDYQGEILVSFDAGLVNHNGSKVASFLNLFEGELYVGSYVNGENGMLRRYDLTDAYQPQLISTVSIPQRIQGITFKRDSRENKCYMFLSQGYETEDSNLLKFVYDQQLQEYLEPIQEHRLPEGAEQIQMTADGMYILFESAARPYRATARIPNDQIWLVRA